MSANPRSAVSCNQLHPFVYVIIDQGDDQTPPRYVVESTDILARSPEDVGKRALFELAQTEEGKKLDPARLEVVVRPFRSA